MARLASLGASAEGNQAAPVVFTELDRAAVARVSQWAEVDQVYLDTINHSELNVVLPTTYISNLHSAGFTGSGVPVAQIEVGGRVATANPNLAGTTQDTTSVCATASGHSTAVAGIIRSTNATYKGAAPAATLRAGGSCSGTSSQLQARSTAAVNAGARVLNLSWGSNTSLVPGLNDRFYDDIVINSFRTVVKSAGNEAGGCNSGTGNVTSPGLGYNTVAVGNFDDKGTVSWSGDAMSSCSSWKDPLSTNGDRELPHLAAPGTNISTTTTASPWTGNAGSGTSFAAPVVTGTVALMIQRNAALASWPEAVRAILMATATHNIEGATRLSELDGAGGLNALQADRAAANIASAKWGGKSYTCSAPATDEVTTMSLTSGKRLRTVVSWDSDTAYSDYANRPSADLDLRVVNSSGTIVASSSSFDNTYEIVDFTVPATGTYKLQVVKYRCDLSPRWLGWSWSMT